MKKAVKELVEAKKKQGSYFSKIVPVVATLLGCGVFGFKFLIVIALVKFSKHIKTQK